MADEKQYIELNHTDISFDTITKYINDSLGIAYAFKGNKRDFLDYISTSGKSNMDRIFEKYSYQEQIDNPKGYSMELLKMNTTLIVPISSMNIELQSIEGKDQFLEQKDFNAFYGKSLLQLMRDPLYRPKYKFKYNDSEALTYINPHISVWIYCGALNQIINVTPYVISCNINVSYTGGNFEISLPPIINLEGDDLYKVNDVFYSNNSIRNSKLNKNNNFYFHRFIQSNDIVFIKFEELDIEREQRSVHQLGEFIIDKSFLAGQIYDMIGLVETNVQSTSFASNDVKISISGKDMLKLLIDDGSYFMPLMFVNGGASDVFVNLKDDDKLIKRTFVTGDYTSLFAFSLRSIPQTIQFIINQLANLGIVDESVDLFSSYGERRTKVYRTSDNQNLRETLHIGVWQIIKLLVEQDVADRRIADSSISQSEGSLMLQFQKLCQEPFVEFFGDTYGDFYNIIVRQPPHTKSQILSIIDGTVSDSNDITYQNESLRLKSGLASGAGKNSKADIMLTIDPSDVISENFSWEDQIMYSWYEITPQGSFIGSASELALAYIPIVYFPEYANKWGLKKLSVVSNYISYQALTGKDSDINRDLLKESIINDFKFMIDSYSYMPFTRKGSITMNGDRRFKHGTWIRYAGTGEIFYVDGVSNAFSISSSDIDRTTTLTLSRGLVEKYTKGSMTYFDIIDTRFIKNVLIEKLTTGDTTKSQPKVNIKSNFGVNKEAFDFFYQRRQFEDKINTNFSGSGNQVNNLV
jgi:hypothetical protein